MHHLTRRDTLALGLGAVATLALPIHPAVAAVEDRIAAFTGGAAVMEGGVTLTVPEIAENGASVPVGVAAPGAVAIMLLATANPEPGVATARFGAGIGAPGLSTRIRLSGTQDVVAIARMADGSYARASATVIVTVGGCAS